VRECERVYTPFKQIQSVFVFLAALHALPFETARARKSVHAHVSERECVRECVNNLVC